MLSPNKGPSAMLFGTEISKWLTSRFIMFRLYCVYRDILMQNTFWCYELREETDRITEQTKGL